MNAANKKLRVLLSVGGPSEKTNPFVWLLCDAVGPLVVSSFFSWRIFVSLNYDVLHLHWPEEMLRGRNRIITLIKCVTVTWYVFILKMRGIPILWTVHNPHPHEGLSPLQRLAYTVLVKAVTYRVFLSDTMRPASSRLQDSIVIPHGHYKSTLSPVNDYPYSVECDFIYFGRIKPYKGVAALLDLFEADYRFDATLRISGYADPGHLKDRILEASLKDHRISSNLGYLDEAKLHAEIRSSKIVVLPYTEMFNSGALLLALSLGRAVVAPRTPTTEELANEVGPEWVFLYDGDLSSEMLSQSLNRCPERDSSPDLSQRDWKRLGEAYQDVYERILAKR